MTPDQYRSLVQQLAGALKDAVAALGGINSDNVPDTVRAALTAAKEALEQPVPSTAGEREAFEAWFRSEYHGRLDRNMPDKSYNDPAAHSKWDAWQARAILAAASTQPVREPLTDEQIRAKVRAELLEFADNLDNEGEISREVRAFACIVTLKEWPAAAHGITKKGAPGAAEEQTP